MSARGKRQKSQGAVPSIRCAIYCRKSTEEGLDQDFNSLDAQREAAEDYIKSQRHEGWLYLPSRYDDGGFSGGNMDRPALNRLLKDVVAGKVDCIVVYKVDRLSRSLLDFARIMETLDRNNVSFVSVTQQFNTTNSMGRLTLNVLLSFAQFEREIIAERTRDKMSAARRKGKWTGGQPVLGYDVDPKGGRLIVNVGEAEIVRAIYALYLENQALVHTVQELNRRGWTTKRWTSKKNIEHGGKAFDRNMLSRLLMNYIYIGKVRYRGEVYPGEHDPIVEEEIWRKVQSVLRRNGKDGGAKIRNKHGALLRGLLFCIPCNTPMNHCYTAKGTKRYRYYTCGQAQRKGWNSCPSKSIPAAEIEAFLVSRIRSIGSDPTLIEETHKQAILENKKRIKKLEKDRRDLEKEIAGLDMEVCKLVGAVAKNGGRETQNTERLADLQERIRSGEKRIGGIREEISTTSQEQVNEKEIASALSQFDPLWNSLSKQEQARILHLLVERVGFDGETGKLSVTFRPAGIKALSQEVRIRGGGVAE